MNGTAWLYVNKYRTAIMGFSALWIYLFHEQGYEWCHVYFSPEVLSRILYFVKRIGFCGVDIFLLLSGIGLVYGIEKYNTLTFYRHRLERVFIPLFLSGVVMALVEKWSLLTFLRKVFLYDFLFVDTLSFLWYIPSVLILYLFFPLYYAIFKRASNKPWFTTIFILIWLAINLLLKDIIRYDLFRFTNRIPIFLLAILLGWYMREGKLPHLKHSWLTVSALFIAGIYLVYLTTSRDIFLLVPMSYFFLPAFLLGISVTICLARFYSLIDNTVVGSYVIKTLSFVGTVSLEIYCVQDLVDNTIRTLMMSTYEHWMQNWWKINLAVFICVIIAAYILSTISRTTTKALKHIF